MYSSCDTPKGGFPHSEISGSKLICQLPEAYRRLSRPSSPVIAKASTTCSYSLDPITLIPLTRIRSQSRNGQVFHLARYAVLPFELLRSEVHLTQSNMSTAARSAMKRFPLSTLIKLYELLKNSRLTPGNPGDNNKEASCEAALVLLDVVWWRMTGSNRRPPACKAGALPAELIPRDSFEAEGWWVWLDSNQRPPPYQDGALTN
jgi:hypothetical protein